MDKRKHFTSMNLKELQILKNTINSITFKTKKYSLSRLLQRNISLQQVANTIKNGEIIEFHVVDGTSPRVLLRGQRTAYNNCVCVVVDIVDCCLVTAYKNDYDDRHDSLNTDLYIDDIDVIGILNKWEVMRGAKVS